MIQVFNIKSDLHYGILNLNEFAVNLPNGTKREIEHAGKQYLIDFLLNGKTNICYTQDGKPFVENSALHISISHSHDKLAVIINKNEPTGIDIELIRDKVKTVKNRFLSEAELLDAGDDVEKLLIYWACKEALYKIYGLKDVEFIRNLFVEPFTKHNLGSVIGEINMPDFTEKFNLNYELIDNYVMVYVLNKITTC